MTMLIGSVPANVIAAVRNAPSRQQFDIANTIFLKDQILKADDITIFSNAVMVLANTQLDWVAIAAKRLFIQTPTITAVITRPVDSAAEEVFRRALLGAPGKDGAPGPDGIGFDSDRHGHRGGDGENGTKGGDGITRPLPMVYLMVGEVKTQDGHEPPTKADLRINLSGVRGGQGGQGGRGGRGGHGHHGDIGRSEFFDCKQAAGNGGRGGDGGRGGQGGHAGTGCPGGTIAFVAPASELDKLLYFEVLQEGGPAGPRGLPGAPGVPGSGGDGGAENKHCKGGGRGANGNSTGDFGDGEEAADGVRGDIIKVELDVVSSLF